MTPTFLLAAESDPAEAPIEANHADLPQQGPSGRAHVAFTESLGPETLVHFRANLVEQAGVPEQFDDGPAEPGRGLGDLLVARFGAATPLRPDVLLELKVGLMNCTVS